MALVAVVVASAVAAYLWWRYEDRRYFNKNWHRGLKKLGEHLDQRQQANSQITASGSREPNWDIVAPVGSRSSEAVAEVEARRQRNTRDGNFWTFEQMKQRAEETNGRRTEEGA